MASLLYAEKKLKKSSSEAVFDGLDHLIIVVKNGKIEVCGSPNLVRGFQLNKSLLEQAESTLVSSSKVCNLRPWCDILFNNSRQFFLKK